MQKLRLSMLSRINTVQAFVLFLLLGTLLAVSLFVLLN